MFKIKHTVFITAMFLFVALFVSPVSALEVTVDPTTEFCFSADDFTASETDDGIFITAVPSSNIATVCSGARILKAGDALTTKDLNSLSLQTQCVTEQSASIEYCTVSNGKISGVKSLKMTIRPKKNDPPTAENSTFETYKNITNTGELKAHDPEGLAMTYTLVTEPKRGSVILHDDGTFIYTPNKNKVGKDRFEFSVTDDAGNISVPATVNITILKPTMHETYTDMAEDDALFHAVWMYEQDLFKGSSIAGNLCFSPNTPVSRGEFLVMAMKLLSEDRNLTTAVSGFSDENEAPVWMQPYIAQALSNGIITGTANSTGGLDFRPNDNMTTAEAAVMLQNILNLPIIETVSAFDTENTVPVWAADAVCALYSAGASMDLSKIEEPLTRKNAATLLYDLQSLDSINNLE